MDTDAPALEAAPVDQDYAPALDPKAAADDDNYTNNDGEYDNSDSSFEGPQRSVPATKSAKVSYVIDVTSDKAHQARASIEKIRARLPFLVRRSGGEEDYLLLSDATFTPIVSPTGSMYISLEFQWRGKTLPLQELRQAFRKAGISYPYWSLANVFHVYGIMDGRLGWHSLGDIIAGPIRRGDSLFDPNAFIPTKLPGMSPEERKWDPSGVFGRMRDPIEVAALDPAVCERVTNLLHNERFLKSQVPFVVRAKFSTHAIVYHIEIDWTNVEIRLGVEHEKKLMSSLAEIRAIVNRDSHCSPMFALDQNGEPSLSIGPDILLNKFVQGVAKLPDSLQFCLPPGGVTDYTNERVEYYRKEKGQTTLLKDGRVAASEVKPTARPTRSKKRKASVISGSAEEIDSSSSEDEKEEQESQRSHPSRGNKRKAASDIAEPAKKRQKISDVTTPVKGRPAATTPRSTPTNDLSSSSHSRKPLTRRQSHLDDEEAIEQVEESSKKKSASADTASQSRLCDLLHECACSYTSSDLQAILERLQTRNEQAKSHGQPWEKQQDRIFDGAWIDDLLVHQACPKHSSSRRFVLFSTKLLWNCGALCNDLLAWRHSIDRCLMSRKQGKHFLMHHADLEQQREQQSKQDARHSISLNLASGLCDADGDTTLQEQLVHCILALCEKKHFEAAADVIRIWEAELDWRAKYPYSCEECLSFYSEPSVCLVCGVRCDPVESISPANFRKLVEKSVGSVHFFNIPL
jgi:hypothetical protein